MRNQKTLNIEELLNRSNLAKIMQKGLKLHQMNEELQKILPPAFQGLFQVANIEGQNLTFLVASAVVRQGFLFRQQQILALIQQHYPEVQQLHFKISPMSAK